MCYKLHTALHTIPCMRFHASMRTAVVLSDTDLSLARQENRSTILFPSSVRIVSPALRNAWARKVREREKAARKSQCQQVMDHSARLRSSRGCADTRYPCFPRVRHMMMSLASDSCASRVTQFECASQKSVHALLCCSIK